MRIEVAVLPQLVQDRQDKVCIVIDALRATSSLAEIVARGARSVWVAPSLDAAREQAELARSHSLLTADTSGGETTRALLCGEVGGLPPEGFDHGNSPSEFAGLDLVDRDVILCTSNGTKALRAVADAPAVLAGSLLNAEAVVKRSLEIAEADGYDLTFVASGKDLGTSYSLEDTYVAGCLVAIVRTIRHGLPFQPEPGFQPKRADFDELDDSALAALRLFAEYRGDHLRVFHESVHGRHLVRIGFEHDLEYCARLNVLESVPRLDKGSGSAVLIRADQTVAADLPSDRGS